MSAAALALEEPHVLVGPYEPLAPVAAPAESEAMTAADVPQVIELLRAAPQAAYCEWEDEGLLSGHLAHSSDLCRVIRTPSGRVVAALLMRLVRRTGKHQPRGGRPRPSQAGAGPGDGGRHAGGLPAPGVNRIFLAVLDGNEAATALWTGVGFRPALGERTFECDL